MKFAYPLELFPQHGESWIRYELEELARRGHGVRVYATWPRPVPLEARAPAVYTGEVAPVRAVLAAPALAPALPLVARLLASSLRPRWQLRVLRATSQALHLAADLERFEPDLLVCHFAGNRALLGSILAAICGRPFVMVMHARDVWRPVPGLPALVGAAAAVWTISQFNVDHLRQSRPDIDWGKLRLVRVGVALDEFPFAPAPAAPPQLLFVARLVPAKGADTLIEATATLARAGRPFTVTLCGDGPARPELEALSRRLGVEGQVRFAGKVASVEIAARLRAASAFVLPSRRNGDHMDGIPVALMEAMAVGAPVVTTDVSGIPELVQDRRSGVVVRSGDARALAEGIERVWDMGAAEREKLVREARRTVERLHDVAAVADELERVAAARAVRQAVVADA